MKNELKKEKSNCNSILKSKCTFDNFVVANNNRFAHAMALAVANAPGNAYNPSFIYGDNGLGKTHLMHAIENKILEDYPDLNVLYVSSNNFINELIDNIKENKTESFRDKYRNVDVLFIDDIQFIAGKERIQEEVFYIFNDLYKKGKQMVISSDKLPKNIDFLEDRLKYRFESGLLAGIFKYDYDTRLEILRREAKKEDIIIDDEIVRNIAKKFTCNIMELKGVFNIVVAYSKLLGKEISKKTLNDIIKDM